MDAKVTLSFRADVIEKAKIYAESQGISLSRLTEILLNRLLKGNYSSIEEYPVSDWVNTLAEGPSEYNTKLKSNKKLRQDYHEGKHKI